MRGKSIPLVAALAMSAGIAVASSDEDRRAVAALDTEFQAAVKRHDAATIDRIQHPDMVLVLGDGTIVTKADHLQAAREKKIHYEVQDEEPGTQTVRVSGDTAVVGIAAAEGNERGEAVRPARLVQRHLRAHPRRLEVLLRPGLAEVAGRRRAATLTAGHRGLRFPAGVPRAHLRCRREIVNRVTVDRRHRGARHGALTAFM